MLCAPTQHSAEPRQVEHRLDEHDAAERRGCLHTDHRHERQRHVPQQVRTKMRARPAPFAFAVRTYSSFSSSMTSARIIIVKSAAFTTPKVIRALVIEELNEEYVRTAKAKGAGRVRIVRAHLLRNVTLPLVTMIGVQAATSLGGVVFIETVFDLPGLGGMLRRGAQQRDLPLTAGSVLFLALAIMALNLVVDILYGVLDPRIRAAARTA